MSIVAAKCPVCGRDIGFDEKASEYTCIFCGAKLLTSALRSERVERLVPEERPHEKRIVREPEKEPEKHVEKPAEEKKPEPELTEEEIKHELERKVGFKEELRQTVKQIDELRAKRDPLKARLKLSKVMSGIGVGLLAATIIAVLILISDDNQKLNNYAIIGGVILGAIAVFVFLFASARKRDTVKAQKKLEESISEKKQKRDVLIGRLNKINKKLHIHSDD